MWYAVVVIIELATGDVSSHLAIHADKPFEFANKATCEVFIAAQEPEMEKYRKDYAIVQSCQHPVGGQAL